MRKFLSLVVIIVMFLLSSSVVQANDKVWICHEGHAISVDANGWNGHDNHSGDFITDGPNSSCSGSDEEPTEAPTRMPTDLPTENPTEVSTSVPTLISTDIPTDIPTKVVTEIPTNMPTDVPTEIATFFPTATSTEIPVETATAIPTNTPTGIPQDISEDNEEEEYDGYVGFAFVRPTPTLSFLIPVTGNCPEWIDVKIEQPFAKDLVLIQLKNNIILLGYYDITKGKWYTSYNTEIKNADMWYQFPDPPKNVYNP